MSYDRAVDLVLDIEESTRTATSGSARHSVRTRSPMSSGTSTGALTLLSDSGFTHQMATLSLACPELAYSRSLPVLDVAEHGASGHSIGAMGGLTVK
jgi:hypothetical protein